MFGTFGAQTECNMFVSTDNNVYNKFSGRQIRDHENAN